MEKTINGDRNILERESLLLSERVYLVTASFDPRLSLFPAGVYRRREDAEQCKKEMQEEHGGLLQVSIDEVPVQ